MFMNRKKFRILCCGDLMASRGRLRFGTLTVRLCGLSLREVADMWRSFTNCRWWRKISKGRDYVMVYEPHPNGHGWHIHFVCNFWVDIHRLVVESGRYGFGVCWMEGVGLDHVGYICKYITKSRIRARSEGSRNVRICNVSRSLLPLRDIDVHSSSIDFVRDNWHNASGFPSLRWQKLYWRWLLCQIPSLEHQSIEL